MNLFVYIDAENLRNSMEEYGYKDFNYEKAYDWFKNKLKAKRIYIFVGIPTNENDKKNRFKKLKALGYEVKDKDVILYPQKPLEIKVRCKKCKNEFIHSYHRPPRSKANCDVDMTLEIINHGVRGKYDEILVFSGDGDFGRIYEYVAKQLLNKKVQVYAPMTIRTSTKIKELNRIGVIKLLDLASLLQHYAVK